VRTPRSQVGTEGARMLLQLIRGETPPHHCVRLGYEVIVRQSS
jgi:LacI family transcriptional regulator, gluconate utilization system Gnt-I transcriptional repressor